MANGAPTVSNGLVISGLTTTSDIKVGTGITLNVYCLLYTSDAADDP